jgi:AmpD protein
MTATAARRTGRLAIDAGGRAHPARWIPSPNHDRRPEGAALSLIVVHGISLPPGSFGGTGIVDLFTNRLDPTAHPYYGTLAGLRVSAHFCIRRGGELLQFVRCRDRAWHAGASSWRGCGGCNDFSIGVELEGTDDTPYTAAQYRRLASLARALARRYPGLVELAGHADVAPGRKTDPGPAFDWARLSALLGAGGPAVPEGRQDRV